MDGARAWAEQLAALVPRRAILRNGLPYLDRYYLAGWNPSHCGSAIPALYLHHFVADDSDEETHSHPWGWSLSLMLAGGYREERCDEQGRKSVREFHPGELNLIRAEDRHRVELLGPDCWTLFMAGPYLQPWGFHDRC